MIWKTCSLRPPSSLSWNAIYFSNFLTKELLFPGVPLDYYRHRNFENFTNLVHETVDGLLLSWRIICIHIHSELVVSFFHRLDRPIPLNNSGVETRGSLQNEVGNSAMVGYGMAFGQTLQTWKCWWYDVCIYTIIYIYNYLCLSIGNHC